MSPARKDDDELEDDAVATATEDGDEAGSEGEPEYKLSLSVDVQDNGPCRKHVKITIPRADIEHFYEEEIGDLLVSALMEKRREDPAAFTPVYQGLLAAGGTKTYVDAVAPFGMNPRDKAFWKMGCARLEGLIDAFEALL